MAKLTAQQAAAKWNRNYTGATEQMKQGVQQLTVSPMELAVAAGDRYISGVQKAYQDGRWAAGLQKVSLPQWKTAYIEKGIPNAAAGARLGMAKYQAHEQAFAPIRDQIVAGLPPRGTLEENIQRMVAMARGMATARQGG